MESDVLAPFSAPFAYVVCDEEYQIMTEGVQDIYKENVISLNAANVEESYDFAKDLCTVCGTGYRPFQSHGLLGYMDTENSR